MTSLTTAARSLVPGGRAAAAPVPAGPSAAPPAALPAALPAAVPTALPAAPPVGTALSPIALAAALLGVLLAMIDFFIVNVALPSMATDLSASTEVLELVVSGYATAYAVLLVVGGRLGDAFGRRRLYLAGMAAFTLDQPPVRPRADGPGPGRRPRAAGRGGRPPRAADPRHDPGDRHPGLEGPGRRLVRRHRRHRRRGRPGARRGARLRGPGWQSVAPDLPRERADRPRRALARAHPAPRDRARRSPPGPTSPAPCSSPRQSSACCSRSPRVAPRAGRCGPW